MNKSYHKEILHIALPSILSNITLPLLGLIDLTIAGHLGAASYIGAIAIGGTIFNMIYWIFAFLRMGTSGMTSQAYGADNKQEIQLLLYRSLATSTGIAILILLLQGPLLHLALSVMSPTEAVADFASVYFRICVWGAPAVLGLYSLTGWFIGLQNAKYPLYVAIVQNLVNIAASLFFVFVWHMDVAGVALGTVIAQYCGVTLSLYIATACTVGSAFLIHSSPLPYSGKTPFAVSSVSTATFSCAPFASCASLYFTSAGSVKGIYLSGQCLADAILHPLFLFHGRFRLCRRSPLGQMCRCGRLSGPEKVIRNLFLWGCGVALTFTLFYMAGGKRTCSPTKPLSSPQLPTTCLGLSSSPLQVSRHSFGTVFLSDSRPHAICSCPCWAPP